MSDQEDSPDLTPRERESMSNIPAKKGPVGDPRLNLPFYAGVKFQVNKGSETSDKQRTKKPDEKNDDPESPTPKKSKASFFALQNPEVNYPTADNNVLAKTTFASNFSDENSRTTNDMDRRKEDQEGQKSGLDGARKTGLKKSKPGSSNYKGPKNANLEPLGSNVVSFLKPTNPKPTSVTDPSAMLNPVRQKPKSIKIPSLVTWIPRTEKVNFSEYPALMDTVKATINKHKGSHYLTEKNRKEIFEATDKVFRYNEEIYHRALKYRHDLENCVKDYRKIRSQFESSQETLLKITEDFKVYIADAGPKLANYENLLRRNDELEKKTKNLEKTFGIQQNLMNVHMKKFEDFRRTTEKRETEFNRLKADVQKKDEEVEKLRNRMIEKAKEDEERVRKIREQSKVQLEDRKIRIMDLEEHVESLQGKLKLEKERRMIKSQEKKATIKKMRTEIENYRSFMIKMNEKYREASISQMQLMAKLKRRSYRIKQLKEQIKTTKAGPVEKGNSPILNSMSVQNREKSNTPEVFPPKLDEYDSPGFLTIVLRDSTSADPSDSSDRGMSVPPQITRQSVGVCSSFVINMGDDDQPVQQQSPRLRMKSASEFSSGEPIGFSSPHMMNIGAECNFRPMLTPQESMTYSNPANFAPFNCPGFQHNVEEAIFHRNIQTSIRNQNTGMFENPRNQFSSSCGVSSGQSQVRFHQFQQQLMSTRPGFANSMSSGGNCRQDRPNTEITADYPFSTSQPPHSVVPRNEIQMRVTTDFNEFQSSNQEEENQESALSITAHVAETKNEKLKEFLCSTVSGNERPSTPLRQTSGSPSGFILPQTPSTKAVHDVVQSIHDEMQARKRASENISRVIKLVENGEEDQTMEELASGEVIDFNRDISETINRALSSRINNEEKDSDRPVGNEELGRMFLDRNWEEAENVVDHVKSEIEESEFVTEEMSSFRGTNTEPHFGPLDQQDDRGVEELLTPQTEELESANSRVSDGDYYFRLLLNAFENRDNSLEPEEANREASDAAIKSIDQMRKSCGRKRSIIHQIPCCNYDIAPEILKACEHVGFDVEKVLCHLPPQIVFTLRPGYVICEGGLNPMDRKTVAIWSGDAMSDFSYEPTILGARIINFPPQITYTSNGYGNIPFGKVIVDVEYEHYSEVAYLSDEMMSKYQVYLFVDELNFEKLNNGLSEVRFTGASYNRNCNPITLMTISAFHKTRFGSFREIPNENPRPPLTVRLQSQESGCSSTSVADVNEDFPKTDYGNSKQYVPMTVLKDLLTASQLRIIERLGYHT